MKTREEWEEIIDALEYRLAQAEDRLWSEANETDRRSLRHRREMYYKKINKVAGHA